jgi:hypothetical protein
MNQSVIAERAKSIASIPAFAVPKWWLTFYLCGDPGKLDSMGARLFKRGGVNTGGAEGGFLYPKLEVPSDPALIAEIVAEVQQLATTVGVEMLSVDVDTSPQVEDSLFKELIRFNGNGS